MSEVHYCDCACLGCSTFHRSRDLAEVPDAHHTRLLLALDVTIAAACASAAQIIELPTECSVSVAFK